MKNFELGHNQIGVLIRLSVSNPTMGQLCDHIVVDKASMTRTVNLLEREGLVKLSWP